MRILKVSRSALLPLFRSGVQGQLLATLFNDPSREWPLSALAALLDVSLTTVQREVQLGEEAGVVASRKVGRTRLVHADDSHPLSRLLGDLVVATYGPQTILADELRTVPGIDAAYLFGSWAARYSGERGAMPNDIDVLVLGQPERQLLFEASERAERRIGLPVQTTIRSVDEWEDLNDPFISTVRSRPVVPVFDEEG